MGLSLANVEDRGTCGNGSSKNFMSSYIFSIVISVDIDTITSQATETASRLRPAADCEWLFRLLGHYGYTIEKGRMPDT